MKNTTWELGQSRAARFRNCVRRIGWTGLCLLVLTVPARADIPPADACMTAGEACSNTDNGEPGVCKESTCSRPTPGGSMTYECYRCLRDGGGGASGAGAGGATDTNDAGASSGGTAPAEGGAPSSGGSSSEASGGRATSGGASSFGGSATSTGGNQSSDDKDSGGCSVSGAPRKSGALALLFGMSLVGLAFRRQRRS